MQKQSLPSAALVQRNNSMNLEQLNKELQKKSRELNVLSLRKKLLEDEEKWKESKKRIEEDIEAQEKVSDA